MNVVIYARYSSSKQNETSIEAQLKECRLFCKKNNYNVIAQYVDKAFSAKTDNRPDFQKMIEDSNKKKFEGIVVYQLDRFARNRYDSATYKSKLKKNGVRVLSAKENLGDDASAIIVESVLEGMAEYYSAELAQKVIRNMQLNAEKGYFNGGYTPLGYRLVEVNCGTYKKKQLEINPETAPIIKEIFEMRANDTNILDIVDYLNGKGYKTVQGNEFKKTSLQHLLKNKKYIGINTYNNEEYPNTVPAIIDVELFNKVQKIIDNHKYAPATTKAKEEYILSGKLYCGNCKENFIGNCGTSQTGERYYYYTCNGVKKKKCKRKNIKKSLIENYVVQCCRNILTDENIKLIVEKVYEICQKENSENGLIKSLKKQVKELNKNIDNLVEAIANGANIDLINNKLNEKRKELAIVEENLENESNKIINLNKGEIEFFLSQLKNGSINSIKYRKTLVNMLINRIYIYDDNKITIICNVGNESITITSSLLEGIDADIKNTPSLFLNNLGQPIISSICSFL